MPGCSVLVSSLPCPIAEVLVYDASASVTSIIRSCTDAPSAIVPNRIPSETESPSEPALVRLISVIVITCPSPSNSPSNVPEATFTPVNDTSKSFAKRNTWLAVPAPAFLSASKSSLSSISNAPSESVSKLYVFSPRVISAALAPLPTLSASAAPASASRSVPAAAYFVLLFCHHVLPRLPILIRAPPVFYKNASASSFWEELKFLPCFPYSLRMPSRM